MSKSPVKHENTPHLKHNPQSGNVFFALFAAVAVVGVLGAGIMSTMRGPLSAMVEVNNRERARTEMVIASRLVILESTDNANAAVTNDGDCDLDGLVEPLEYGTDIADLTGGGTLPISAANQTDPWGTEYGYCAWDAGTSVDDAGCGGASQTRLSGSLTSDTDYSVIAIISAGPDGVFETTCADHSTLVTPGGDDLVEDLTYDYAVASTGGLWSLQVGDSSVAEIDKNLEVTGGATFSDSTEGISLDLSALAGSLLLPDQTNAATCSAANDQILRRNTASGSTILQLCDFTGTPNDWAALEGLWNAGSSDDIYYNTGTPQVGIGLTSPDDTLDVDGTAQITGATVLNDTLSVTGLATLSNALSVSGTANFASTIDVTGTGTIDGDLTIGTDSLFVDVSSDYVGIGTASPNIRLELAGTGASNGVGFGGTTDTLYYDSNIFNFTLGGSDQLSINNSGDVFSTTGDGFRIDTNDAVTFQTATANNTGIGGTSSLGFYANSSSAGMTLTGDDLDIAGNLDVSGDLILSDNTDANIIVADGSTFNSVALSGDATIDNAGAITLADDTIDADTINTTNTGTNDKCLKYDSGNLEWGDCFTSGGGSVSDIIRDSGSDTSVNVDTAGNGSDNTIVFTNNSAQTMIIDASGQVGIGVAANADSSALLDLTSTSLGFLPPRLADTSSVTSPASGLMIFDQSDNTMKFNAGSAGSPDWIAMDGSNNTELMDSNSNTSINVDTAGNGGDDTIVFTNNSAQTMIIDASGNVGIGEPSPDVELDVAGDIEFTGTITDVSDQRLKTNIEPAQSDSWFNKVMAINTYSFTMKDDPNQRIEYGVIAQELEQIFPDLVKTANDEMGTKSVNYMGLIAPLITTTQSLYKQNETLIANIKTLEQNQTIMMQDITMLKTTTNTPPSQHAPYAPFIWIFISTLFGCILTISVIKFTQRN